MLRNKKGQFKKKITAQNVFGLVFGVLILGIPMVDAYNAGKQVSIKQGESVTVTCETPSATPTPTPTLTVTPSVAKTPAKTYSELEKVKRHTRAYAKQYGGKMDDAFVDYIYGQCKTVENTKIAIAIATKETGQGRDITYSAKMKNNYFNFDRFKEFSSREKVADALCANIRTKGYFYNNLIVDGKVNYQKAWNYVVGPKAPKTDSNKAITQHWIDGVMWSYSRMQ